MKALSVIAGLVALAVLYERDARLAGLLTLSIAVAWGVKVYRDKEATS